MEYSLPNADMREWNGYPSRSFIPNDRQMLVVEAARKALAAGLFYSVDVLAFCIKELKATPEQVAAQFKCPVEGGFIGMDVYYARHYVEAQESHRQIDEATKMLKPAIGQVLGTLIFSDGKRSTNCVVTSITEDGLAFKLAAKRGNSTAVIGWINAIDIEHAMDRAAQRGARKAGFAAFVGNTESASPAGSLC